MYANQGRRRSVLCVLDVEVTTSRRKHTINRMKISIWPRIVLPRHRRLIGRLLVPQNLTSVRFGFARRPVKPSAGCNPAPRPPCSLARWLLCLLLRGSRGRRFIFNWTAASPAEHTWGRRRALGKAPLLHKSFVQLRRGKLSHQWRHRSSGGRSTILRR